MQPNTLVTAGGITQEGTVGVNANGSLSNVSGATNGTGTVGFIVDQSHYITSLNINGSLSSFTLDASNSSGGVNLYLNGVAVAVAGQNLSGSVQAIYANPLNLGFNYQTFGVWGTGLVPGQTANYGAISGGAVTLAASVPNSGTATFVGVAGGIFSDAGNPARYASSATFNVDFSNQTIGMQTTGSTLTYLSDPNNVRLVSYLNMSGNFNYSSNTHFFTGSITATGSNGSTLISGNARGQFYGPSANELGGTFVLSGGSSSLVGGFGAKHQ